MLTSSAIARSVSSGSGNFVGNTRERELCPYFSFKRCLLLLERVGSAALRPGVCFSPLLSLKAQARALRTSRQRREG
jgi:hypothetical protein